ncbi:ribosome maturation factor RimM [Oceanisphaera psychrotolerans]|uniref:Ribosome maturation factor RimM n=1 Tax=Oceanisphaera psychrotolerans TaxID=1414654 RepID=A0A1J4QHF2_9GAMM|nr:ribosome maturation factor RimM [Oceanisphaera psychrotolerans]OIN10382.1 ribosome maturation factor RimM [Oceanisphaera psychrotolerans]
MSEPVVVGQLGAVYGIKGWLKVNSFTDQPEGIFDYQPWLIKDGSSWREIQFTGWKRHNKSLICKLADIDQREQAQLLTGADIAVSAELFPALPGDEFYWRDLIGCRVQNIKGYDFGLVSHLMETGSNDVLVVKANANDAFGQRERLIPFLDDQVIKSVNLQDRIIEIDWDPDF